MSPSPVGWAVDSSNIKGSTVVALHKSYSLGVLGTLHLVVQKGCSLQWRPEVIVLLLHLTLCPIAAAALTISHYLAVACHIYNKTKQFP